MNPLSFVIWDFPLAVHYDFDFILFLLGSCSVTCHNPSPIRRIYLYFVCVDILLASVLVHHFCTVPMESEEGVGSLWVELQAVVSCSVGAGS